MIKETSDFFDILQKADCSKEIKVFEKFENYELVYYAINGKCQFNNIFKNIKNSKHS